MGRISNKTSPRIVEFCHKHQLVIPSMRLIEQNKRKIFPWKIQNGLYSHTKI